MRKKLLAICLFLVLTTSACNAQAPVVTVTPTLPDPQVTIVSLTPNATETLSEQPTATPTLETPIPTNPPDCTNSAAFVADVSVADNDIIASGITFTKTWRI